MNAAFAPDEKTDLILVLKYGAWISPCVPGANGNLSNPIWQKWNWLQMKPKEALFLRGFILSLDKSNMHWVLFQIL